MGKIFEYYLTHSWLIRLSLVFAALFLGWLIEKLLFRRLKVVAERTKWRWDDVFVSSLNWIPLMWLLALSLYLMGVFTNLDKTMKVIIQKSLTVLLIASFTIFLASSTAISSTL